MIDHCGVPSPSGGTWFGPGSDMFGPGSDHLVPSQVFFRLFAGVSLGLFGSMALQL